jgi:hypothetical protein
MEKMIVMTPEDYNVVKNYLSRKPLPHFETEPVMAALGRAKLTNIDFKEKEEEKKK